MKPRTALNFLFATVDGGGNVAPAMSVARALVKRGHRVRVMSDTASEPEARAAGAMFVPWRRAPNKPDRSREAELIRDWAAATPQEGFAQVLDLICGRALDYAHDLHAELDREPADLARDLVDLRTRARRDGDAHAGRHLIDPDAKAWWHWHASIAYEKCPRAIGGLRVSAMMTHHAGVRA